MRGRGAPNGEGVDVRAMASNGELDEFRNPGPVHMAVSRRRRGLNEDGEKVSYQISSLRLLHCCSRKVA